MIMHNRIWFSAVSSEQTIKDIVNEHDAHRQKMDELEIDKEIQRERREGKIYSKSKT